MTESSFTNVVGIIAGIGIILASLFLLLDYDMQLGLFHEKEIPEKPLRDIYAFEYEYGVHDKDFKEYDEPIVLKFYDMEFNELEYGYWYHSCLDDQCKETVEDRSRPIPIVKGNATNVFMTVTSNHYLDLQKIQDYNKRIIDVDYHVFNGTGNFYFEMEVGDLKKYVDAPILPLVYLFFFVEPDMKFHCIEGTHPEQNAYDYDCVKDEDEII